MGKKEQLISEIISIQIRICWRIL